MKKRGIEAAAEPVASRSPPTEERSGSFAVRSNLYRFESRRMRSNAIILSSDNTRQPITPSRRSMGRGGWYCTLLIAMVSLGCETPSRPSLTQVSGKVSFEGKPLSNARVVFIPTRATQLGWDIPFSYGMTDESGTFALRTETGQTGVMEGWSEVWVIEMPETSDSTGAEGTSLLRYSRHRLEVPSNPDRVWSVEIDHKQGFRTQASIPPPAWAVNLHSKFDGRPASRDQNTRVIKARDLNGKKGSS